MTSTIVDILILGAGWTSDFLIPLLIENQVKFAATTRDGRPRSGQETIKFQFDPDAQDSTAFRALPDAQTVLITFPIYKSGGSKTLVSFWEDAHLGTKASFIQLGSSRIWNGDRTLKPEKRPIWSDRRSPFDTSNDRARAETELLELYPRVATSVLDLSGLWGGQRHPRNWINRVAPTKEALAAKENMHLIHGEDVARAILVVHSNFASASGQRWLLTDGRVYDWWDIASAWSPVSSAPVESASSMTAIGSHAAWVRELMKEVGIRALPRPLCSFERALDSREFWETFQISPVKTLLSS